MTSSNEGTPQGVNSDDGHPNSEAQVVNFPDTGYFSSSPLGSPLQSAFSTLEKELSLGVFFLPDDGEANDVLAALRASQKVVKETREVVMGLRPRTEQVKEFAEILHAHERDFTTWIYDGAGILPTTRIAIRSLPMFAKLVIYINLLKDLQSDLPYLPHASSTPPARGGSVFRRLSTAPSRSGTNSHSLSTPSSRAVSDAEMDPRLAVVVSKVIKSFDPLKDAITVFAEEQRKLRAYGEIMERTRKELGIPHDLCLQGTRQNIRSFIDRWIDPPHSPTNDPSSTPPEGLQQKVSDEGSTSSPEETSPTSKLNNRVLVVLGPSGSGKSALATTLACEWKRSGTLGAHLFIVPPRPATAKRSSTGKRSSGEEADADRVKGGSGIGHHHHSLSRALSLIPYRRGSSSSVKVKTGSGVVGPFLETLGGMSTTEKKQKKALVVIDGIDHASEEDAKRVVDAVKGAVERDDGLKVLLTTQKENSPLLDGLKGTEMAEFIGLDRGNVGLPSAGEGNGKSGEDHGDTDDIRRYVASRLAVLLRPVDQERVVEAVEGRFADAVRICRDVLETAAPERALDGVLYHEAVRRHGMEHVKVILV